MTVDLGNILKGDVLKAAIAVNANAGNDFLDEGIDYNCSYSILDDSGKVLDSPSKKSCFGSFHVLCERYLDKNVRYLRYRPEYRIGSKTATTWIRLCIDNGLIADTLQSADEIYENGILIDFGQPWWTIDRVYSALVSLRFLREANELVNNVITLSGAGIDFWIAFVYCQSINIRGVGHSFLGISNSRYGQHGMNSEDSANIGLARFLKNYFSSRTPENSLSPRMSLAIENKSSNWHVSRLYSNAHLRIKFNKQVYMLLSKASDALNASTDEEAKNIVTKVNTGAQNV